MTTQPQPKSGRPYGARELISLLAKKWGEDYLAADEAAIAATIRARLQHSRVTPEDVAKVNNSERIDMSKYKSNVEYIATWGESLLKSPHNTSTPREKNSGADSAFFHLTRDFSEKVFEEFTQGTAFNVSFANNKGLRELTSVEIQGLEGLPGDTVVRYNGTFAILKKTHQVWKHKNELP